MKSGNSLIQVITLGIACLGVIAAAPSNGAECPACRSSPIGAAADTPVGDVSAALRGYGKLKLTRVPGKDEWVFEATSAKNATTTVGKFLADLNLSPGVTTGTLAVGGKSFKTTTIPGGLIYSGYVEGERGHVVAAKDEAGLAALLASAPGNAVTDLTYPAYLDRFDRNGWGFYGFETNFEPPRPPGPKDHDTDPIDDMDFLGKYNFRFELWPNPTEFDDSFSIPTQRAFGWLLTEAGKRNVPVSARLYGRLPHAKEFTDAFELPATFIEGGWYWGTLDWRVNHRQSFFNKPARLYIARQAMDEMKLEKNHPEVESWMMPYGEVPGCDWYNYQGDISPSAVEDWHETIQNKLHLSLDELSEMYERKDKPFTSYYEVPIPEIATFAGKPGMIQDLEGDWYARQESHPGEGLDGQWWNADVKAGGWDKLHMPGSVFWFKYNIGNREQPKWVIRDFDYNPSQSVSGPVYLYDFARATNNDTRNAYPVYLNGQKIGDLGNWSAWDVTKLLKPGANRLAFQTELFTGRVFLSTDKPLLYPYLGAERNKLWIIFNKWLLDARFGAITDVLTGMREVEPNKPIKIMAPPIGNDNDRWLDTASRFGAWGHFTGEGMWGFFWYKRYGFLYGLPGTSEGAGPSGDVAGQFNLYQRVFLEGLNGHDQVFNVQNITRVPELKQWYEDHAAVLKQMGHYDIAGPQVIIYRSVNETTQTMPPPSPSIGGSSHEIQTVWNWDFARGTFQSIGQSGLYVDNGGLASHKIDRYRIMVDGGNEMIKPEAIKNIGEWVRQGGTYITLPFTGRSNAEAPDSWPIQELTGCQVKALRTPGPGKGTVTIAKDQPLFKELAGQTFPDAGSSMDFQNFEYNQLSVELAPGADCKVVATYENGAPAIVVHKLGKGQVIALGSAFFRASHDVNGLWWSGELESKFFRDLFTNLGQPAVNNTTDLRVVTQRYRTNNGMDDVLIVQNFAGADRTVDIHATVDHPPTKVYQVAMNEIREVPFTVDGNNVTVPKVSVPQSENQVFYFRDHDDADALAHWWQYQNKLWKPTDPVKLNLASISKGRWVDPTVDLKSVDWYWTQATPADGDWVKTGGAFASPGGKPQPWVLDVYTALGADTTKPLYARHTFHVPAGWFADGGVTHLDAPDLGTWGTRCTLYLNGQLLKEVGPSSPDVMAMLKPGENVIAVQLDPSNGCKYLGVTGSLYLTHARPPAKVVDLSGEWMADINGNGTPVKFPGKASAFAPSRLIDIPADWKNKYIVCYYAMGDSRSAIGAIVNETGVVAKRSGGPDAEVDITPYLRFGEKNMLSMLQTGGDQLDPTHDWDLSKVELHLYLKSDYRN